MQRFNEGAKEIKILLTGATGFLGSSILRELVKYRYDVVILKRSFSNMQKIQELNDYFRSYNIDEFSVDAIFETEKNFDVLIHCATNYGRNQEGASEVLKSNLVFPLQALEAAVNNSVKLFINTDTSLSKLSSVQGYMQNYILSKKQFLDWGHLYSNTEKICFVNLVLEHLYGPGDDSSKFIAFLIENFKNKVENIDLTEGEQFRDFVFIDDVVDAYLTIISKADKLLGFNEFEVGSGNEVKIKELVKLTKELMNSDTNLNFGAVKYRDNEVMFSKADTSNLMKLGWEPKYDLRSGLEKYISKILKA